MDEKIAIGQTAPLLAEGPKLYLIDARHSVERKYLLDWLHATLPEGGPGEKLDWISLPISDERKLVRFGRLADALERDPDTLIVPVRVAWRVPNFDRGRAIKLRHLLFGNPRMPNSLRARSILLRDKRRAHCITGSPATIADLRERFDEQMRGDVEDEREEFAAFVARQAGLVLDIVERGLRGSRYKVPRFVSDGLRANGEYRSDVRKLAEEEGQSPRVLFDKARGYLRELVARPTPAWLDIRARFEKFLLGQGYDTEMICRPQDLERLRQTIRDHPTLVLFTHKTYLDGITPTQLTYQQDLPMLHLFGGINMAFFGIGPLFRKSGAIFIRRSFNDNKLYKLTLRHYIAYLMRKRFPMAWAFEGTRSRLGKLMPPKYGLLKYVLGAAHESKIEDVHIVPFVTSFDIINDVDEFASEQTGRKKRPESFSWFLGYMRSLRRPLGKIYIDLGETVVVKQAPDPEDPMALSKIAFDVAVKANEATPLTLTSVICLALLGTAPRGLTEREIGLAVRYAQVWAGERNIRLSPDLESESDHGLQQTIENLVGSGLLLRDQQGSHTIYTIEPDKHPIASYYRNSIVHHFLYRAIAELAIFKAREVQEKSAEEMFWDETDRLRDLFKFEFFWPGKKEYRTLIRAELNRADPDWKDKLERGGEALNSLIENCQPLISHTVFLPYVEAYTVVLDILSGLEDGEEIDEKALVDRALTEARQALLLRRITSEASIGKLLFQNGFTMAKGLGLTGVTDAAVVEKRKALLRKFRRLSNRMERARIEALTLVDKVFE